MSIEHMTESDAPERAPPAGTPPAPVSAISQPSELPGRLGGLTVRRQVATLALWPFLEQMMGFAVGFVDTAIAGRLSVAATESVAVGAYVGWLMNLMFGAVGIGVGALVARGVGGRHRRQAYAAIGQGIVATIAVAALLMPSVWLAAPGIAHLMNLSGEAFGLGRAYLRVLALSTPALGIMFVSAASLRSAGDTRSPFFVLALVNVVNVMASLLFVYGPAPWGGHGVRGIAMGTACAWTVGAFTVLVVLRRGRRGARLHWGRLRPNPEMLKRISRISIPQLGDSLAMWAGNFVLAGLVGYLGAAQQPGALAAHIVVIRIEALSFLPAWALAQAAATLMGQYLGLGDPNRARQAVLHCWGFILVLSGSLGLLFMLCAEPFVRLLTAEERLLTLAPTLLVICGPVQIFLGSAIVLEQAIRGAGDTRPVAILVTCSTFALRLPLAYVLGIWCGYGIAGIWVAISCENVVRGSVVAAYFLSNRWQHTHV